MKKNIALILAVLILAAFSFAGCGPDNKPITSAKTWDKIMADSYDAITKAGANFKHIYLGSNEGLDDYFSHTFYVDGSRGRDDHSGKNQFEGEINRTYYYEIEGGATLNVWSIPEDGGAFVKSSWKIDLEASPYLFKNFRETGLITMGAHLIGECRIDRLTGLLENFTFSEGVYKALGAENLEKAFRAFTAIDPNVLTNVHFDSFSLKIEGGLVSEIEWNTSLKNNPTTKSTVKHAITYGGQSVALPE